MPLARLIPPLAAFIACASLSAQQEQRIQPLTELTKEALRPLWDRGGLVALSIGVGRAGELHFTGLGETKKGSEQRPDEHTVFEIGSVSKAFTGTLLGIEAANGIVTLKDATKDHLPEGWSGAAIKDVTLEHLASHLSGLARLPPDLFLGSNTKNPYAHYHQGRMKSGLLMATRKASPGTKYQYSNFGAGLLGTALSEASGVEYEELLKARILNPLGMSATFTDRNKLQQFARENPWLSIASGYGAGGEEKSFWDLPAFLGAGGVRSTTSDMMRFLEALRTGKPEALAPGFELALEPVRAIQSGHICLGWHRARDGSSYWHNGQTGGFRSYASFNRKLNVSVVVFATGDPLGIEALGEHLLRCLAGSASGGLPMPEEDFPPTIEIAPELLARHVGRYRANLLTSFTVELRGKQLFVKLTGQSFHPIFPMSDQRFAYRAVEAEIEFEARASETDLSPALVLFQNGRKIPAKRIHAQQNPE